MKNYYFLLICFLTYGLNDLYGSPSSKPGSSIYPDARGQVLSITKKPQRIVSASVASDEILWLILEKAKSLERLIGVSYLADQEKYSHISEKVKKIPFKVGKSLETFVKAQPDLLILASFNRPELIRQIEQLSVPVFVMNDFSSIEDIVKAVKSLASLIGERKAGELVVGEFMQNLKMLEDSIQKRESPPKVLAMVGEHGVIGQGTLFDSMLKFTGAVNASSQLSLTGWPQLGDEALVKLNPDFVVFSEDGVDTNSLLAKFQGKVSTRSWNAVKRCSFIRIPSRNMSAASPFILEGIQKIKIQLEDKKIGRACGI